MFVERWVGNVSKNERKDHLLGLKFVLSYTVEDDEESFYSDSEKAKLLELWWNLGEARLLLSICLFLKLFLKEEIDVLKKYPKSIWFHVCIYI